MIKLTGINKIYRTNEIETVALENVNLEVNKGEFLSIMGPSGCGKSTLLNIMGLLDAPTSGTIEIAGTKVDGMKDKELAAFRNQKLGFVLFARVARHLSDTAGGSVGGNLYPGAQHQLHSTYGSPA